MAKKPPPRKAPAPKGPSPKSPVKTGGGRPAGLFTWVAVALVVVVVATLVIIKVSSGSSGGGTTGFQAADPALVADLTTIPTSVFDTVGVTSSVAAVSAPIKLKGQSLFTGTSSAGTTVPQVFYLGGNYCPFCAAERWAAIIALSRFGTWSGLGLMTSSTHTGEIYPGTPTFTFQNAKLRSTYLAFSEVEQYTNQWSNAIGFYGPLQKPSKAQLANFKKYDTTKYIPGITTQQDYSIPYITVGDQFLISGASFTPSLLANQTRDQIATGLKDPTSPVTDAIITTANLLTAAVCHVTKNQPGNVCMSKGVLAAKKALGIK
ncbi:MAG: DUF929 family protein [Acidimicrobiales bacterium]